MDDIYAEIFDMTQISDDSDTDYIFEVDMAYTMHLHEWDSDLPLALEHMIPPTSTTMQKKIIYTLSQI